MITKVKGTKDWLDVRLFEYVISTIQTHVHTYNFHQIQTPLLEYVALFKRTLGEETDVVSKEMFLLEKRSEKDAPICLRPEMTASIMRACIEHNVTQFPWKIFSYGPCFRYERPQKGRLRQFHQINIETIGAASMVYDIETITMLDRYFHETLHINTYALQINFLGCATDQKNHKKQLLAFIQQLPEDSICNRCIKRADTNCLRIFDCKNEQCTQIYKNAPKTTDCLCNDCNEEWEFLQKALHMNSISYVANPHLVRGLDYYHKTVFEFVSPHLGAQNAFCGGGRYNQLATQLGAKNDLPSIGAAIGIERLLLLLEPIKDSLAITKQAPLICIIPLETAQEIACVLLADTLRAKNKCIDVLIDGSIKTRMKKAHTLGAQFVLIMGPEEQHNATITIKNMLTGTQKEVPINTIANHL